MDNYVSPQDLADRLGVSVFTIRRYIRAGKLPAVKLDGGYRIGRDDIAEFLKSREIGGSSDRADAAASTSARGEAGPEAPLSPASSAQRKEA